MPALGSPSSPRARERRCGLELSGSGPFLVFARTGRRGRASTVTRASSIRTSAPAPGPSDASARDPHRLRRPASRPSRERRRSAARRRRPPDGPGRRRRGGVLALAGGSCAIGRTSCAWSGPDGLAAHHMGGRRLSPGGSRRAGPDLLLLRDADRGPVDDLVEVLGEPVAHAAVVERPLGQALGDARDELSPVRVGPAVAQRDEVEHLAGDLPLLRPPDAERGGDALVVACPRPASRW